MILMSVVTAAAVNLALAQPIDRSVCLDIDAAVLSMEGERVTVVERSCDASGKDHSYIVETADGRRFSAAWPFLVSHTGTTPPGH